jgi:WD40 repeat protein
LTVSDDGTARVWDVRTGRPVTPPLRHAGPVRQGSFRPDGRRVVTSGWDGAARVWDAGTGRLIQTLRPGSRFLGYAAFSPGGRRVVTAVTSLTRAGEARVWEVASGRPLTPPLRHDGPVLQAAFSRDGRMVATASADGTARVWDAATGDPVTLPLRHPFPVASAVFSADDRRLVIDSKDETTSTWEATGSRAERPRTADDWKESHRLTATGYSPTGERVVWDLRPEGRPAQDLVLLARLWAARRVEGSGGLGPLERAAARDAWQVLRRKGLAPPGSPRASR